MKVLIYIEPHPIRNSTLHFKDIAKSFMPLLINSRHMDIRLFSNTETLEIIKDSIKTHPERLIWPSAEDELIFDFYKLDWLNEGLSIWLQLMMGSGQVSNDYMGVLDRIWQHFPFDVIIHWGENGAVSRFSKMQSITKIGMELGCTRSPFLDSLVMDPYGTNGAGLIPKLSVSDLSEIVEKKPMSCHEALFLYSQNLESIAYEDQFKPLPDSLAQIISKSKKLAFLPLQLFDDANMLRFSRYKTLTEVVLDVVPKLANAGYTTIITPHPDTKNRPQSALASTMAKVALHEWADKLIWLDPNLERPENAKLISICDVVVTVNSSVGFEALYFDKPVIVLGDAVYKPIDLFPSLEDFIEDRFDLSIYQMGISWLRRFALGSYLQSPSVRSDISLFEHRIELIDHLYKNHKDSPLALAKEFWLRTAPNTQSHAKSIAFFGNVVLQNQKSVRSSKSIVSPVSQTKTAEEISDLCWLPFARRLIRYFGFREKEDFSSWLFEALENLHGLEEIITICEILKPSEYIDLHSDLKDIEIDPLAHYLRYGLTEKRAPQYNLPGISEADLKINLLRAGEFLLSTDTSSLIQYQLSEEELSQRNFDLDNISRMLRKKGTPKKANKIAVVAHLYYRDLVPEILEKIKVIPEKFDLIVTLPRWGAIQIEEAVRSLYPDAFFYHAPNRGRDIGPFVDLLPIILHKKYDVVLKIQTKRGYYLAGNLQPEFGALWREESLNALLGSRDRVLEIINTFRSNLDVNMVGASPYYLSLTNYPYHDNGLLAENVLGDNHSGGFFAGTMFWVRPSCLAPLISKLELSMLSFTNETGENDGTLAHLIERMFGHAALSSGKIMTAPVDPMVHLCMQPKPHNIKIHDHIELALKTKRVLQMQAECNPKNL